MKKLALFTALVASTSLAFSQGDENKESPSKEATAQANQPSETMKKAIEAFSNLPQETRNEFIKKRSEAAVLFQNKRIFEALEATGALIEIFPDDPQVLNLRGACYVEIRDFERAQVEFKRSMDITGPSVNVVFNVAEIAFVTQKWQESLDKFTEALSLAPENALQMRRLIEFKIMLSHISLSKDSSLSEADRKKHAETVKEMAAKYDFRDNSPYHYYAQSAYAYSQDDKKQGDKFLFQGRRVYSGGLAQQISAWEDTMTEYGYIKNFYGNDANVIEGAEE